MDDSEIKGIDDSSNDSNSTIIDEPHLDLHPITSDNDNDKNIIVNDNDDNNNNYQINSSVEIPMKKRRRTVNKLFNDPENLPLCDLLFYNPPETIFQKESRKLKEDEDPIEKLPKPCLIKRRSSRSSSVSSDQSNKDRVKQIIKNVESLANDNNKSFTEQSPIETQIDEESSDEKINPSPVDDDQSNQMLVIDESGNIVLKNPDQSSSLKETKSNIVNVKSSTTYKSFRREKPKNAWNSEETGIFYTALELVGTDFSLMEAVFFKNSNRDRKQLKQKFKREEKVNRAYIDNILYKSLYNRSKIKLINGQLIKDDDRSDTNETPT